MKLPDEAPRLPKLPFLVGDVALLLTALLIAEFHPHPSAMLPLLLIVGCVVLGAVLAVIPFLTDYARQQDEAARDLRHSLDAQLQRFQTAAAQLDGAVAHLNKLEETALKNLQVAERLPHKLQEKIAEFKQQLDQAGDGEKEALVQELTALRSSENERLETVAAKIHQTVADATALETALRKHLAAAQEALGKSTAALANLEQKSAAAAASSSNDWLPPPAPGEPAPAPAEEGISRAPKKHRETPAPPAPEPVSVPPESPATSAAPAPPSEDPVSPAAAPAEPPAASVATSAPSTAATAKPPRKRAPKKTHLEGTELALPIVGEPAAPVAEPSVEKAAEPSAPDESAQLSPEETAADSARSADGQTRLLVTAYIGIGNRVFIRGEGPGLSWDKGVPLDFVSIGKWRWESPDVAAPVRCRLLKNDETESPLGRIIVEPGQQLTVTATF